MTDEEKTKATDKSNDRKYFTVTPRLVWALSEDPYEYTFWCIVKDIAGEDGECILSRDDMAILSMMSGGKASKCRTALIEKKLLVGDFRQDPGYSQPVWHLSIPDFWEANIRWSRLYPKLKDRIDFKREQQARRKPSPGDGVTPGDEGMTPGDEGGTPGDLKKNALKKNQQEEQMYWQTALDLLKTEFSRSSFVARLQETKAIRYDGNALTISVPNADDRDLFDSRVRSTAERLLVGILGCSIRVEFVTMDPAQVQE